MKPIGLYIHIPFCLKKCHYCDFASYAGRMEILPAYLRSIETELDMQARRWPDRMVETVFIGGGTPSVLLPGDYQALMGAVRRNFQVSASAEISLESNPGTVTAEKAEAMRSAGINRISIGVQAAQDQLLHAMGRIHRQADAVEAVGHFKKAGFSNINLDLMFGLPGQSAEMWRASLAFAVSLRVTHLSCYSLAIEANTPWGVMLREGRITPATDELDRFLYHEACSLLAKEGFIHYELSNFAKPGFSCRHNLVYWKYGDYLGTGAAAHSLMDGLRFANTADPDEYMRSMDAGIPFLSESAMLSRKEALSERMLMGMRLMEGVRLDQVSEEFGLDVAECFAGEIGALLRGGLVSLEDTVLRLTEKGYDLANQVFLAFV